MQHSLLITSINTTKINSLHHSFFPQFTFALPFLHKKLIEKVGGNQKVSTFANAVRKTFDVHNTTCCNY